MLVDKVSIPVFQLSNLTAREWHFFKIIGLMITAVGLAACASKPPVNYSAEAPLMRSDIRVQNQVVDGRGRFREIFCAITAARGQTLPDYRPCDRALTKLVDEPPPAGRPVPLGQSNSRLRIAIVLGLGWECFEAIINPQFTAMQHVAQFGYDVSILRVDGLSSSTHNAKQIRDAIMNMSDLKEGRSLVLIGYSKGTPDILEAIALYPEVQDRVAAVISMAGAVGGSPLADDASQSQVNLLRYIPGSKCDKGDEGALDSLRPETRQRWLANHQLPESIRYYSLVAYTDRENISVGLRSTYDKLNQIDPRNDSQILFYDQVIPSSVLLGYLNADHWAVAVPVARSSALLGATFVDKNAFPREVMLEAILRYVEEDLAKQEG